MSRRSRIVRGAGAATGLPFALAVAAVAASPAAQTHSLVVPPSLAAKEGNSFDREPIGSDRVRHVQYVHRNLLTRLPRGAQIRAIAYRRDGVVLRNATLRRRTSRGKNTPPWTVQMGNVPLTTNVQAPPPGYPRQGQAGWTTVLNGVPMNFPDLPPPPASGPAPFTIRIPFTRPHVYGGQHLGIDHFAYMLSGGVTGYAYYLDAVASPARSGGKVSLIGPGTKGCPSGANRATGLAPNPGGGDLEMLLFGAPSRVDVFAALGASDKRWGNLTLPLDLGPLLGLPGCKVYTDLSFVTRTRTSNAGVARFAVPVPSQSTLLGATLFGQWVVTDPRVNPAFGLATSDGLRFTLGTEPGAEVVMMSVVSATGGLARNRVGFVQPHRGTVVQLQW